MQFDLIKANTLYLTNGLANWAQSYIADTFEFYATSVVYNTLNIFSYFTGWRGINGTFHILKQVQQEIENCRSY